MTCVITVTNGDWQYLDEWITYHHILGVDMFLIAYNGHYEKQSLLPKYDFVRYFDFSYNEMPVFDNLNRNDKYFGIKTRFQSDIVGYLLNIAKDIYRTCDYAICIDSDEFVYIENNENINSFLDREFNKEYDFMQLGMINYGDGGLIYNNHRPVLERLDFIENSYNPKFVKHLRFRKQIIYLRHKNFYRAPIYIHSIHYMYKDKRYNVLFDDTKIHIKHFITKTIEEWIEKFDHNQFGERIKRFEGQVLAQFFLLGHNKITDAHLRAAYELFPKYKINYKPELEEIDDFIRNRYIEVNNIHL